MAWSEADPRFPNLGSKDSPFESAREVSMAMQHPEYKAGNAAYHAIVAAKLEASDNAGFTTKNHGLSNAEVLNTGQRVEENRREETGQMIEKHMHDANENLTLAQEVARDQLFIRHTDQKSGGPQPYSDQAEMIADMRSPAYRNGEAAAHAHVQARIAAGMVPGVSVNSRGQAQRGSASAGGE